MFSNQADISWSPKKSITFKIQFERYQDIKAKLCAATFYKPIYIIFGWKKKIKTQTCMYRLKVFLFYFIPYLTFLSFCVSYILWFDRDAFRIQRYLINLYQCYLFCGKCFVWCLCVVENDHFAQFDKQFKVVFHYYTLKSWRFQSLVLMKTSL